MDLVPIPDVPALSAIGSRNWVCIADLHIGIEVQLRRAGFNIPSQAANMLAEIQKLAPHGDNLLILGDVKHRIPAVSYKEDREIPPFLNSLLETYESITIVAGNHDGGLGAILPEGIRAVSGGGVLVEDFGAIHGHVWPSKEAMKGRVLVMGHIHPSILLVDSLGGKNNEKCWVRGRLSKDKAAERYDSCPRELIVVPAFNPLLTGTPINRRSGMMLGPVFRNQLVDPASIRAHLLNGTDLGFPAKAP
ncbi:MAG: hypothetical protein A3K76_06725 [Euryarchaeota archaeon RBG_13_57_23]|nr:MAG: hypothetical protein A3K76_06725 [Euryarchaeota archaeon RBG_13_57_23]